ncbi:hypothetical protein J1N35_005572 [Gossypium stocksii]|uniref:Uncharacterized protein n=1 Tax=Gossypium stocksii TaxID=47602 RepID=A0A9D3WE59_9ROSI|nr:hypothetical protein J1N35_005572 [Gossypium stocksii]
MLHNGGVINIFLSTSAFCMFNSGIHFFHVEKCISCLKLTCLKGLYDEKSFNNTSKNYIQSFLEMYPGINFQFILCAAITIGPKGYGGWTTTIAKFDSFHLDY